MLSKSQGFAVLVCALSLLAVAEEHGSKNESDSHPRKPRFGLFNLVSFRNEPCYTQTGEMGVCYSAGECRVKGGFSSGTCAQGFGTCCLVTKTCGESIRDNNTFFVNPSFHNQSRRNDFCMLAVHKMIPTICQIRLEFEKFDTIGPNPYGRCSYDSFSISGQDANSIIPVVCGNNSGQHMYIGVGSISGPIYLQMALGANQTNRSWKIKVTQIPCNSPNLAPGGCLQYFDRGTGVISSFNYGRTKPANETSYMVNLRYSMCFRREAGMCSLSFLREGDFGVGSPENSNFVVGENCSPASGGGSQHADYLALNTTKICGGSTNSFDHAETVDTGVMVVVFVSDNNHNRDHPGFQLRYRMIPCSIGK